MKYLYGALLAQSTSDIQDEPVTPDYGTYEPNREYTMEERTPYVSVVQETERDAPELYIYDTRTMQVVGIAVVETRGTLPYGSYLKGLTAPN